MMWTIYSPKGTDQKTDKDVLLDELITSIAETPEAWRWTNTKHFIIVHSSGLQIWIGEYKDPHVYQPNEIRFDRHGTKRLLQTIEQWRRVHGTALRNQMDQANCRQALALLRNDKRLRAA